MSGEPPEETPRRRRVGTGGIDVVVHGRAAHAPPTHEANAEEGDIDGAGAARGTLPQAMAAPGLASGRLRAQMTQDQAKPGINLIRGVPATLVGQVEVGGLARQLRAGQFLPHVEKALQAGHRARSECRAA